MGVVNGYYGYCYLATSFNFFKATFNIFLSSIWTKTLEQEKGEKGVREERREGSERGKERRE
jgi:uncharacterized membrane protein